MKRAAIAVLPPLILLALAAFTGSELESARDSAGIPRSAARVPLGGFEPGAVSLLWLRQEELLEERRLSEAVATIRLVTELQPRVPDAWALLGGLLAWHVSDSSGDPEEQWRWTEEALRIFGRGIEHNPDAPKILFELGFVYAQRLSHDLFPDLHAVAARHLGRPPEALALEAFRELAAREPDYAPYAVMRGETARQLAFRRLEQGDEAAAIPALEEARDVLRPLSEDPDSGQIRERLEQIERLLERLRSG